jgi:enoyl-CoA hydratase
MSSYIRSFNLGSLLHTRCLSFSYSRSLCNNIKVKKRRSHTIQSASSPLVHLSVQTNGVALITLRRPEARNALSTELARQFACILEEITQRCRYLPSTMTMADTSLAPIRAVVLTGEGTAFCAGADLKERQGMSDQEWEDQHKVFQRAALALYSIPVPTIAAVNGHAFGGGLELVCLADWSIVASKGRFRFPEVHLGIFPGLGATVTLPRLVGPIQARRYILTADTFTAQEGYHIGLFAKIVEDGPAAVTAALDDAAKVAQNGPQAVQYAKKSLRDCSELLHFTKAWDHSLDLYSTCFRSEERMEGIRAYGEKRPPKYQL